MRDFSKFVVCVRLAAGIGLGVAWSTLGYAQTTATAAFNASPQETAAEHFERGLELYREGSLDAALVEFERAYESVPDYRVLYNLAQVQTQRGEYVEALSLFDRYLKEGGTEVAPTRRTEVEQDIVKLNGRVGRLWVESSSAGAEVFVNGKLVGSLPMQQPVLVNSGMCEIRVTKPGFEPRLHQLKVAGGEQPRVSLPLTLVTSRLDPAVYAPSPPPKIEQVSYTPFWVSLAATAVFGGGAAGFGYLALDAREGMDDELARLPVDRAVVLERSRDVRRYSTWGDLCGAAAVLAGGTALYFLISPTKSYGDDDAAVSSLRLQTNGTSAVLSGMF